MCPIGRAREPPVSPTGHPRCGRPPKVLSLSPPRDDGPSAPPPSLEAAEHTPGASIPPVEAPFSYAVQSRHLLAESPQLTQDRGVLRFQREEVAMHSLLVLVAKIALLAGSTSLGAGAAIAEKLVIPSVTHADLRFISFPVGTGVPVNVAADLNFPQEKKERYPVVVIGHTIAGWNEGHEGGSLASCAKSVLHPSDTTVSSRASLAMSLVGDGTSTQL